MECSEEATDMSRVDEQDGKQKTEQIPLPVGDVGFIRMEFESLGIDGYDRLPNIPFGKPKDIPLPNNCESKGEYGAIPEATTGRENGESKGWIHRRGDGIHGFVRKLRETEILYGEPLVIMREKDVEPLDKDEEWRIVLKAVEGAVRFELRKGICPSFEFIKALSPDKIVELVKEENITPSNVKKLILDTLNRDLLRSDRFPSLVTARLELSIYCIESRLDYGKGCYECGAMADRDSDDCKYCCHGDCARFFCGECNKDLGAIKKFMEHLVVGEFSDGTVIRNFQVEETHWFCDYHAKKYQPVD